MAGASSPDGSRASTSIRQGSSWQSCRSLQVAGGQSGQSCASSHRQSRSPLWQNVGLPTSVHATRISAQVRAIVTYCCPIERRCPPRLPLGGSNPPCRGFARAASSAFRTPGWSGAKRDARKTPPPGGPPGPGGPPKGGKGRCRASPGGPDRSLPLPRAEGVRRTPPAPACGPSPCGGSSPSGPRGLATGPALLPTSFRAAAATPAMKP